MRAPPVTFRIAFRKRNLCANVGSKRDDAVVQTLGRNYVEDAEASVVACPRGFATLVLRQHPYRPWRQANILHLLEGDSFADTDVHTCEI